MRRQIASATQSPRESRGPLWAEADDDADALRLVDQWLYAGDAQRTSNLETWLIAHTAS